MTDTKSSDSRRKLLKSIVAGGSAVIACKSLPENWTKPVIHSIVLPVHAQTSSQVLTYSTNTFLQALSPDLQDVFIPRALAGFGINEGRLFVSYQPDQVSYSVWFTPTPSSNVFTGSGSGTTQTDLIGQCYVVPNLQLILSSGPNPAGIPFTISSTSDPQVFTGTLMPDTTTNPAPPSCPV